MVHDKKKETGLFRLKGKMWNRYYSQMICSFPRKSQHNLQTVRTDRKTSAIPMHDQFTKSSHAFPRQQSLLETAIEKTAQATAAQGRTGKESPRSFKGKVRFPSRAWKKSEWLEKYTSQERDGFRLRDTVYAKSKSQLSWLVGGLVGWWVGGIHLQLRPFWNIKQRMEGLGETVRLSVSTYP